jgi:hypothetical protein
MTLAGIGIFLRRIRDMQTKPRLRRPCATAQAPTPEPILQLATGFMAAKQLFVANEIGLFGHLREGPLSLDELAQRAAVRKRTTRIVADAMVALGLLEHNGGGYQNGPVVGTFLSGSGAVDLRPLLRFWNHISYPAWLKLEQAVRSGEAQPHDGHFSEEEQRMFSAGVEALTAGTAQALARSYDFGSHRRALDVGVAAGTGDGCPIQGSGRGGPASCYLGMDLNFSEGRNGQGSRSGDEGVLHEMQDAARHERRQADHDEEWTAGN